MRRKVSHIAPRRRLPPLDGHPTLFVNDAALPGSASPLPDSGEAVAAAIGRTWRNMTMKHTEKVGKVQAEKAVGAVAVCHGLLASHVSSTFFRHALQAKHGTHQWRPALRLLAGLLGFCLLASEWPGEFPHLSNWLGLALFVAAAWPEIKRGRAEPCPLPHDKERKPR